MRIPPNANRRRLIFPTRISFVVNLIYWRAKRSTFVVAVVMSIKQWFSSPDSVIFR